MSYKNKVFNKLFTKEVELSKEQIDLSMLDDFKKTISSFNKSRINSNDKLFQALKLADAATKELRSAQGDGDKSLNMYKSLLKKSKELGVNLPSEIVKAGEETEDMLKQVNKNLKAAEKMSSAL